MALQLGESLRRYERFELPPDRPRGLVQTFDRRVETQCLSAASMSAVTTLARVYGCSTGTTLLAALCSLLHRYSGEVDISLGAQIARGVEDVPGAIVGAPSHSYVYHADFAGDPTFTDLLARVRSSEPIAWETLVRERIAADEPAAPIDFRHNPLFAISFRFESMLVPESARWENCAECVAAQIVDLQFGVTQRVGGWTIECSYDAALFDGDTVRSLLKTFGTILSSIAADPDERISRIALVSAAEREWLVVTANNGGESAERRSVPELISEQALRVPKAVAVVCGKASLTYAELETASNRLAREFMRRDLGPGKRIGILLERSLDLVVALLAVLKAGSAYVPLDPDYPQERLSYVVGDARLAAVISRKEFFERIDVPGTTVLDIDADFANAGDYAAKIEPIAKVDTPAYVIYTSGSTGRPKGVVVGHGSLRNVLLAVSEAGACDLKERDVHVAVVTISFDPATLDIFLPLINGARLVIAEAGEVANGRALRRLLESSRATFVVGTPIVFELLLEAGWSGDPALKICCGGEAMSRRLADDLLAGGNAVWNAYGPTESTILSSLARVAHGSGPVLLGPPIANTQFYVLDANGELLPPGARGELYIGGDGVALEYLERADLTAERFVPDTFRDVPGAKLYRTGDLVRRRGPDAFEFLGRTDRQVKIRGLRIELGEIETMLLRERDVAEAVAIVRGNSAAEKAIWAFVVRSSLNGEVDEAWLSRLRANLSRVLPYYMIPAPIVVLDALPRMPNGKIDRAALLQVESLNRIVVNDAPLTEMEQILVSLIGELLEREGIGRNDDIFALGFYSLLAVRLVDRIERAFGVRVPLRALYDAQTVARLATHIVEAPRSLPEFEAPEPIATLNAGGSRPPLLFWHNDLIADGMYCRRLAVAVGAAQPIYAIAPHGTAGLPVRETVEKMAHDYVRRIRELQPSGPYRLGGICASGLIAFEVARQLRMHGDPVEKLVLINALPVSTRTSATTGIVVRAIALSPFLPLRFREKFCYNVVRTFEALDEGPHGVLTLIKEKTRALYRRLKRVPPKIPAEHETLDGRRDDRRVESIIAHLVAPLTYRPRPYDGELTLFWSTGEQLAASEAHGRWRKLAKKIRMVSVSGDHISPVQDGVEEFGRALREVLAD